MSSVDMVRRIKVKEVQMPFTRIHVLEGRYDEDRLGHVSTAVQDALISVLKIPSDDFFQVIHVLPRNRFLHSPSFLGMRYSDDLILLEVAFISGRPRETRLTLLKELNAQIGAIHDAVLLSIDMRWAAGTVIPFRLCVLALP